MQCAVHDEVPVPAGSSDRFRDRRRAPGRRAAQVPAGTASAAGTVLLTGFESGDAMTDVTLADPDHDTATRTTDFAAEGDHALRFDIAGARDSGCSTSSDPASHAATRHLGVAVPVGHKM